MQKLDKTKYQIIVGILFMFLSVAISGQEMINKKIEYTPIGNLAKAVPSEFLSEAIEIPIENPEPFIAIGLNATITTEKNNAHFYIRVSKDGDNWSDWQLVENDDEGEQVKNKFISFLSFFEKENKFIQFHTNIFASLENLSFTFISPGKTDKSQIEKNIQQSQLNKTLGGIERPAYVNRKAWGCPQNENESSRSLTNVTHIIIHHSAGSTVSSDYAAVVKSYWNYHVNTHGWADIGYNWLVDPNGVLYKGRAWKSSTQENVLGAHNSGKNGNTVGICFIGNYMSNVPSDAGLNKIAEISAFLSNKYGIDPEGKSFHNAIGKTNDNITGHGQSGGGTSCPGTQLKNRMQTIRELTASKILDISAAPKVVETYPNAKVDSAYHSKKISIEFTHPMNKTSVESAFTITPNVFGTVSWSSEGNVFYFQPSPAFAKQTNYSLKISKAAMSNWDVSLENDIELNFVTKTRDNLSLVANYPLDGDINIPTNVTVGLKFDGSLKSSSLGGNVLFLDEEGNGVPISVNTSEYSGGIIRFTPQAPLNENSKYEIHLKEGISEVNDYTFGINKVISFSTKAPTSVDDFNNPKTYNLISAYPNPFNPTTTLEYQLKESSHVVIKIYDVIGNLVKTLLDKNVNSGTHKIFFEAHNLPSGVYFSQIRTSSETKTIKLLLTK